MDLSAYISPIITIVIAAFSAYMVMNKANEQLSIQIATLTAKVDVLTENMEKHNAMNERTFKLESDVHTAFKRIDDLKASISVIEDYVYRKSGTGTV